MIVERATSPAEFYRIHHLLHDRFFDLEGVRFDESVGMVSIPFVDDGLELRITHAREMRIHDSERVRSYDLNVLIFDASLGRIRISTGVTLGFEVIVDEVDVSVVRSDSNSDSRDVASR